MGYAYRPFSLPSSLSCSIIPINSYYPPQPPGLGPTAHLAQLDNQHTLHCLNAIRRYAHREHYYPSFTSPNTTTTLPLLHAAHLSHCLHILLQALTCNPST